MLARAVPVQVLQTAAGKWQLLRNGQPYYVQGAGGDGSKQLLKASGANTMRTWGISPETKQQLDEAQKLGLAVIVGIWLGHERHGFSYHDKAMLEEQKAQVREAVMTYKDHPAVLIWGIGNEMEGIGEADDPALWLHIQDLAKMVKELDPNHPTMVVTADIGGKRVESIHKLCPDIDIMGINSYGGLPSLPGRYRALGGTKPYLITEFGPPGVWESPKTDFGAPLEPSSTKKAALYTEFYQKGCLQEANLCLGACAFIWGNKPEATATWFGMLLPDGSKLAAVDAMTKLWSGKAPANLCPEIISLQLEGSSTVQSGDKIHVKLEASDPEQAKLQVTWKFCTELAEYMAFGETWWQPLELGGVIQSSSSTGAELIMPSAGIYRLYVEVYDGAGGAVTANIPIKVEGETGKLRLKLPLAVYADNAPQPWTPSGWMGNYQALKMDAASRNNPHSGDTCMEFTFQKSDTWVGVAWQHPPDNWGDKPGGYDLSGAKQLSFWARSEYGGEVVDFGLGLESADAKYPDTATLKLSGIKLSSTWKKYQISLKGKDLSRVRTPFYWTAGGRQRSLLLYLDDIRFE